MQDCFTFVVKVVNPSDDSASRPDNALSSGKDLFFRDFATLVIKNSVSVPAIQVARWFGWKNRLCNEVGQCRRLVETKRLNSGHYQTHKPLTSLMAEPEDLMLPVALERPFRGGRFGWSRVWRVKREP